MTTMVVSVSSDEYFIKSIELNIDARRVITSIRQTSIKAAGGDVINHCFCQITNWHWSDRKHMNCMSGVGSSYANTAQRGEEECG